MTTPTYPCPRCQGDSAARAKCALCGGSGWVVWPGGAKAANAQRTPGGVLTHVEQWRLETAAAKKAVRP